MPGGQGSGAALLALLRTQDDATSQIATYLSLSDLFHAVLSCRVAAHSALRRHVHRATRLLVPPDEPRARSLVTNMDATARNSIRHIEAADMHTLELLAGEVQAVQSLRLCHHKYLLRHAPWLELSGLRSFPLLVKLDFSGLSELDELTGLESLASSLQQLDVSNTSVGDLTPLYMCTQMRELNLDGTLVDSLTPLGMMDKLHSLNLSYTRHLENLKPLRALLRLKKLVLNRKSIVRLAALLPLTEQLQYLEIADANVQSIAVSQREAFVSALTNVEHLDLSWSRFLTKLDAIRPLTKLRVLNLSGEKYADLSPLASVPTIEELYIKQDVDVDLSAVASLRRLRKLFIYGFRPHTQTVDFLGDLPDLLDLSVSSLFRLGMPRLATLQSLGVSVLSYSEYFKYPQAPQLTELRVSSRVDVNQFLARFSNLHTLQLEDIDGVKLHSLSQFTQLDTLRLGRMGTASHPTPEDHAFLRPLTQLRRLSVHWTTLSDLFVLAGMKQLEELSLDGTSVKDVWHLTALEALRELSLDNTKVRTVQDLTALPRLRKITLPKNASCAPLLDAFHAGTALEQLTSVCHPVQNCLWGQHRNAA